MVPLAACLGKNLERGGIHWRDSIWAATFDTVQETPPLWQFVSVADYRPPTASVKVVSENWFAALLKRIRPDDIDSESACKINSLEALSHGQLARIAPAPDWGAAVASLEDALENWLTSKRPDRLTVFLIGSPHGGSADILRLWAEQRQWRVLNPPALEQIITGDPRASRNETGNVKSQPDA